MPVLAYRPVVFLSSSIGALKVEREQTKRAIEAAGLAVAWLFEFHATAGGDTPDAQYLLRARASDVFVLLIADEISIPTWQEYEEAFADNPAKVLPFLIGPDTEDTRQKRAILAQRHTYKHLDSVAEVPAAVAAAIEHMVGSGALLIRPLDALIQERIARLRSLLDLPGGLELPSLATGDSQPLFVADAAEGLPRVVLTGPAGSGKTHAALKLLTNRRDHHTLPVYIRVSAREPSLWDLIAAAFRPARFEPGPDLLHKWARDGRLCIVFDGLDEVADTEREDAIAAIESFAEQHPRCSLAVATRSLAPRSLAGFSRIALAPIADQALVDLFKAAGYELTNAWELPDRFAELIRRPLWAGLLASVGLGVRSAVELLQQTISRRVVTALPNEPVAATALRAGLGILALEDQANPRPNVDESLRAVARWQELSSTRLRYTPRPGDWFLDQAARSGLATVDGNQVVFAHPLISACLGAEALVEDQGLGSASALTRDGRVFLSVLLPEARREDVLLTLTSCDIFALASVSRLAPPATRSEPIEADLARFDSALGALSVKAGLSAASAISREETAMCRSGDFVALRRAPAGEARLVLSDDLTAWASPGREAVSYTCWMPDPFKNETPELLAAAETVALFKGRMAEVKPSGSPWGPHDADSGSLLSDRDALSARLVAFARQEREFRLKVLCELGLEAHPLALGLDGNPEVIVKIGGPSEPRYTVTWGDQRESVSYTDAVPEYQGQSLASVMGDPSARAWQDLAQQLEELLDSSLSSQSPARPTRFPEWIV
jgi:hypothetical protein